MFLFNYFEDEAECLYENYCEESRKNNLVPGDIESKMSRLRTTKKCLENHLPIQDKNSGIKNIIDAKPTDPEAYLLWKKEAKFLSKTAF